MAMDWAKRARKHAHVYARPVLLSMMLLEEAFDVASVNPLERHSAAYSVHYG